MTIENLTKQIFDECAKDGEPITIEEAREMAEMEIKAKDIKLVARAVEPKAETAKKPKNVKISQEKQDLFNLLWEGLSNYYENCKILTNNKEIFVQIAEKTFSVNLVEHRKPKK